MQLTIEFLIGDILDYEIDDIDILSELGQCNLFVVIDLLRIGNKCNEEDAELLFGKYSKEMTLEQIVEELAYEVIGERPSNEKQTQSSDELSTFSDVLWSFYNQIQAVDNNLTLTEFRNMSTKQLYKYCNGLQKRIINEKNKMLEDQYLNTIMLLKGLNGDLKECPRLNEDGTLHKKSFLELKLEQLQNNGVKYNG